ncbi:hypothetical protein [Sphingomonas rubra]|nr:hypothetical protein [Sphingomonas rubra]
MRFFSRMSPVRAYKDLRLFLATREKYEFGFLTAAMAITGFVIYAFYKDSTVAVPYKRDIIYVEQWTADRTDAQIRAQQAIDGPIKAKALAEQKAKQERRQAEFKQLDDQLTKWGF